MVSNYSKILSLPKELSVLFVEDHDKIRESTIEILNNYFKIVETASDGDEELKKYINYHENHRVYYDLVTTDIVMPVLNGVSLVKEIKKIY